jgi:hypothetical protein
MAATKPQSLYITTVTISSSTNQAQACNNSHHSTLHKFTGNNNPQLIHIPSPFTNPCLCSLLTFTIITSCRKEELEMRNKRNRKLKREDGHGKRRKR